VADKCFSHCAGLTNVFLPKILTNIGPYAFENCFALERLDIPDSVRTIGDFALAACVKLVEANLPLNLTSIPRSLFEGCLELSALNIPDQVTNIGGFAFASMNSLTNVTIPASVAFISMLPFDSCSNLRAVYFRGNAPTTSGGLTFWNSPLLTNVYYLPGMTGWGPTFSDLPTALWLPSIKTDDAQFGIQGSAFGFNVQWAKGMRAVIEARDGFESGYWSGVKTNVFVTDLLHFSDESWEDSPHRIYRVRWQKQTSQFGQR